MLSLSPTPGIVVVNQSEDISGSFWKLLQPRSFSTVQHSAVVALGWEESPKTFEESKTGLCVRGAGEAVGYTIDLIMHATGEATAAEEMLVCTREPQRESYS